MLAFQKPEEEPAPVAKVEREAGDQAQRSPRLLCRACRHAITSVDARITIEGHHEHQGVNPGGWVYRFGCFSSAPGCVSRGVPSRQNAWFAGFWWHIQACGGCGEHLGWLFFRGGDESFHGLILTALVEEELPDAC